jgi:hypothetical protein
MNTYQHKARPTVKAQQWPYADGGALDRYDPGTDRPRFCEWCGEPLSAHAYTTFGDSRRRICPGDWVVYSDEGVDVMTCKEFEATFELMRNEL